MGKLKTARRNPSVTWDAIRFAANGERIKHRGDRLTVMRQGRRGVMPWVLRNDLGVEFNARVEENGLVTVVVTGKIIR